MSDINRLSDIVNHKDLKQIFCELFWICEKCNAYMPLKDENGLKREIKNGFFKITPETEYINICKLCFEKNPFYFIN